MTTDPNEETFYRIASVNTSGEGNHKKIKGWKTAYSYFQALTRYDHVLYAAIIELDEYNGLRGGSSMVREEWSQSTGILRGDNAVYLTRGTNDANT